MIYKDGKAVSGIYKFHDGAMRTILTVYKGTRVVWELIRSCFGRGFWINEQPWVNSDGWKNND